MKNIHFESSKKIIFLFKQQKCICIFLSLERYIFKILNNSIASSSFCWARCCKTCICFSNSKSLSICQLPRQISNVALWFRRKTICSPIQLKSGSRLWPIIFFSYGLNQPDSIIPWLAISLEGINKQLNFFTWRWSSKEGSISDHQFWLSVANQNATFFDHQYFWEKNN